MDILHMARELVASADLIVTDRDEHPLIFVEVEALTKSREAAVETLFGRVERFGLRYGMDVDPQAIPVPAIGRKDPLATLDIPVALRVYDQNFDHIWISRNHLANLTEI